MLQEQQAGNGSFVAQWREPDLYGSTEYRIAVEAGKVIAFEINGIGCADFYLRGLQGDLLQLAKEKAAQ